jgi:hypothetical protein
LDSGREAGIVLLTIFAPLSEGLVGELIFDIFSGRPDEAPFGLKL